MHVQRSTDLLVELSNGMECNLRFCYLLFPAALRRILMESVKSTFSKEWALGKALGCVFRFRSVFRTYMNLYHHLAFSFGVLLIVQSRQSTWLCVLNILNLNTCIFFARLRAAPPIVHRAQFHHGCPAACPTPTTTRPSRDGIQPPATHLLLYDGGRRPGAARIRAGTGTFPA